MTGFLATSAVDLSSIRRIRERLSLCGATPEKLGTGQASRFSVTVYILIVRRLLESRLFATPRDVSTPLPHVDCAHPATSIIIRPWRTMMARGCNYGYYFEYIVENMESIGDQILHSDFISQLIPPLLPASSTPEILNATVCMYFSLLIE